MDRDTESIGGLEKPPPPSRQLFWVTVVLDSIGILLSLIIGPVIHIGDAILYWCIQSI